MSDNISSWFHCGRCGSLFKSIAGEDPERLCTECGRNPSLGLDNAPPTATLAGSIEPVPGGEHEKHSSRKRRKSYFMVKLLLGWSLVLLAIIFGARAVWRDKDVLPKTAAVGKPANSGPTQDEIATLNEAGPSCNRCFAGFLAAGTPEERNQFVANPIGTASRMARFYGLNPLVSIEPASLIPQNSAVLHLPKGDAVETLWKTPEGKELDAVFVKEGGEWRLDWDHFVRYSDYPWALFLAGSGDPQGEFRLLARERLADERKNEASISLVLYAPRFGSSTETGLQSPEFLIKRDSENGRLLEAAFRLAKSGGRAFDVKLRDSNPEGLIRLRAKVRRVDDDMQRRFELQEIIACHWYSVDEPGVSPAAQPLEK